MYLKPVATKSESTKNLFQHVKHIRLQKHIILQAFTLFLQDNSLKSFQNKSFCFKSFVHLL